MLCLTRGMLLTEWKCTIPLQQMLRCGLSFALLTNSGDSLKLVGVMRTSGSISAQHILFSPGVVLKICAALSLNGRFVLEDKNYRHHVFRQVYMLLSVPGAGLPILPDAQLGPCGI